MKNKEILHSLLQNTLLGIEKLERRNEQHQLDISQCQELNKEITSKMSIKNRFK
jgi:hypothetical protein